MENNGNGNGAEVTDPFARLRDGKHVEKILQAAVREALRFHKKIGNPICEADENGGVRWIQPEDIPVDADGPLCPVAIFSAQS